MNASRKFARDSAIAIIDSADFLDPKEAENEKIRADEAKKRQEELNNRKEHAKVRRDKAVRKSEQLDKRWEGLERRREARVNYYLAKIEYVLHLKQVKEDT